MPVSSKPVTRDTQIRHLGYSVVNRLALMLDPNQDWEKLAMNIPKQRGSREYRYDQDAILNFRMSENRHSGSPTREVLQDWATQLPNIGELADILKDSGLQRAANYICVDVLKDTSRAQPTEHGESISLNSTSAALAPPPLPPQVQNQPRPSSCQQPSSSPVEQADRLHLLSIRQHQVDYESMARAGDLASAPPREPASLLGVAPPSEPATLQSAAPPGEINGTVPSERNSQSIVSIEDSSSNNISTAVVRTLTDNGSTSHNSLSLPDLNLDNPENLIIFKYNALRAITANFDTRPLEEGGHLVGEGGFGKVFKGTVTSKAVAIKKLNDGEIGMVAQFTTELKVLAKFKHKNLLPLIGYCDDGPSLCIVCEYMSNGSLEDRLECKNGQSALDVQQRLEILQGTAEGINHLHTFDSKPLIHRDIKSANVLLDENLVARVGDFGFARTGSQGRTTVTMQTSTVIGTNAYMAPEAFRFEISTKLDSFSFGVILLEVLTGLPSFDESRVSDKDLASYIEENCDDIMDFVDTKVGEWTPTVANALFKISEKCLALRKKNRPAMAQILQELRAICL